MDRGYILDREKHISLCEQHAALMGERAVPCIACEAKQRLLGQRTTVPLTLDAHMLSADLELSRDVTRYVPQGAATTSLVVGPSDVRATLRLLLPAQFSVQQWQEFTGANRIRVVVLR